MPTQSMIRHKLPAERNEREQRSLPAQSKMCYYCGKVHAGRHQGAHYNVQRPQDLHYIDEQGVAYTPEEANAMGQETMNVSHGWCPDCTRVMEEHHHMTLEQKIAARESMIAAQRATQVAREPIAEAYTPVPEAHTPVEQPDTEETETTE